MKRIMGNLLIGLSIVLMAATLLWIVLETVDFPRDANEDQRGAFVAGFLFTVVLLLLEVTMLLLGRHLRQPPPVAIVKEARQPGRRLRPLPLALYLGGSISIALFATFLRRGPEALRPLWVLVGQPFVFTQLLLGGIFGLKFESDAARQVVLAAANLAYFPALFYPLYRMLTIDRAADVVCYQRMRILLILFGSIHVLIGMAFAILMRA